jgi:hypothetical protein
MADRISFTRPAVERIARVVRAVENARPAGAGLRSRAVASETKPKPFRVCTFTGAWAINTSKVVTFRNVTTTPNTVSAMNLVCGLSPTAMCEVSVAKDGTAWYLVQPNLTQQPGYSGSSTQLLTIVNGSLAWIGTTTVDTVISAALGTAGLVFTRARIQVVSTATASQISIGTTACT